MEPSIRKPLGILAILAGIAVYVGVVSSFAEQLSALPKGVQVVVYLVLGVAWLLPLRPLLVWMNK